jgi:hypothetical protein
VSRDHIIQFFNELPKMMQNAAKLTKTYRVLKPFIAALRHQPVPLFDLGQSLFAASKPGTLDFQRAPFWEAPIPFPSCWYHICYPHPSPASAEVLGMTSGMVHHMIRAHRIPDGRVALLAYGKGSALKHHPNHDKWAYHFSEIMYIKPGENWWNSEVGRPVPIENGTFHRKVLALDMNDLFPIDPDIQNSIAQSMLANIIKTVYFVAYANWVLAQPKSMQIEETAVPVDNKLRRLRNLMPLPPTRRILHVNFKSLRRLPSGNHTGVERAPHDRRGHLRQLADGRIIPVRATKIKGGAAVPRIYELRHDFPEMTNDSH